MADRKISDLTALTTPASGDFLPIVDISEAAAASKNKRITIEELMRGVPDGTAAAPGIAFETDPNTGIYSPGADQLAVATNGTGRLLSGGGLLLSSATDSSASIINSLNAALTFGTNNTERFRCDSSGRLLVGTSSGGSVARLQVQGSTIFNDAFADLCYNGSAASGIAADTNLGVFRFTDQASNSNIFAQISCATDATASSGDYPGRLVFSTTADGAASPTERMRITSDAYVRLAAGTGGIQFNGDTAAANAQPATA
jgi:hypothetical protein